MNTAPIAETLNATEQIRSTLWNALQLEEPRYTIGERVMLATASVFGERAYRRMEHAVNQQHVPGVIADLDRFAHDLKRELGDAYRGGNEGSVQCETARVYIA